jgi:hypothetical protein
VEIVANIILMGFLATLGFLLGFFIPFFLSKSFYTIFVCASGQNFATALFAPDGTFSFNIKNPMCIFLLIVLIAGILSFSIAILLRAISNY